MTQSIWYFKTNLIIFIHDTSSCCSILDNEKGKVNHAVLQTNFITENSSAIYKKGTDIFLTLYLPH